MSTPEVVERESFFERIADWVSAAMGRPTNIIIWLVLVITWTLVFALHLVSPAGTFLPTWFTSQGFNFPLNLVTTVAELFIGFLVAAASNRSERTLQRVLAQQSKVSQDDYVADMASRDSLIALQADFAVLQAQHTVQSSQIADLHKLLVSGKVELSTETASTASTASTATAI